MQLIDQLRGRAIGDTGVTIFDATVERYAHMYSLIARLYREKNDLVCACVTIYGTCQYTCLQMITYTSV